MYWSVLLFHNCDTAQLSEIAIVDGNGIIACKSLLLGASNTTKTTMGICQKDDILKVSEYNNIKTVKLYFYGF